ncbi:MULTISPECIES: MoaD/ThiS family protein [Roseivirga]|jgi:molybdopterin converting factor small subunit|uniref:MoaD/ThiS family protein n=1 Tax=Roseivirga TaxID=290180 RepID=UPI00257EA09F|nr:MULTISPECIES: MoaD/ThiS family protein [Roseivirga]MEC7753306.1 MoaD/ThiS family protein [Bacteroidota bacterium]|tara:strand:- start:7493 stop:7732 length:240 start_codon:yes stop_codon:yes gene_type:complete
MKIQITAFGIAKDIVGKKQMTLDFEGKSVGEVRTCLVNRFPEFEQLASLRFAVNTSYVDDSFELTENDEVVLIPPVSGG